MRYAVLLTLGLLSLAAAEEPPVQQVIRGVSPARADRLYQALQVEGKTVSAFRERAGDSFDNVFMGLRWDVTSHQASPSGSWMVRGRLGVAFFTNPEADTLCWLAERFGGDLAGSLSCVYTSAYRGPPTAEQKFLYDRPVMVTYDAGGTAGRLTVAMLDSAEEAGTFNLAATAVAEEAHAFNVGLSVRQLSLGVSASDHRYTVVATGLPYVVRPVLEVKTLPGGYLTLDFGLLWESRMTINAPTLGLESRSAGSGNVKFSWGNRPSVGLEATGGTTRSEFDSSIMIKTEGDGLRATLHYDESLAHRAYELVARADQKWVMQVHNIAFLRAGSLQEERSVEVGQRWEGSWAWTRTELEWLPTWAPHEAPIYPEASGRGGLPRGGLGEPEAAGRSGGAEALVVPPLLQVGDPTGMIDDAERWNRVQQLYRGAEPTEGMLGSEAFESGQ